jgi:hypothetical protein
MVIRSVVSLATVPTGATAELPATLLPIITCAGTLEKEFHMSAEEIAAMSIEEIKANFFDLVNTVVTTYGDNQEETTEQQQEGEGDAAKK